MRVIAGSRRGFRLRGPAGPGTRPMADKIKGSLFSMLASLDVAPDITDCEAIIHLAGESVVGWWTAAKR